MGVVQDAVDGLVPFQVDDAQGLAGLHHLGPGGPGRHHLVEHDPAHERAFSRAAVFWRARWRSGSSSAGGSSGGAFQASTRTGDAV